MMADAIVVVSTLLSVAFFAAWLLLPNLRAWIERPKYRFQEELERYDQRRIARPIQQEGTGK
jgi:hypothetical protein